MSSGSCGISSICVFVGAVAGQTFAIYDSHSWRWLLLWVLVIWGLRITTSCLSTITSSTLLSSGDGGARMVACLRLALVLVVIARWSSVICVIFITFEVLYTVDADDEYFAHKKT
jgi:hypothetical protein